MGQLGHIALTFAAASNLSYAALLWLSFFGLSENNEAHQAMLGIVGAMAGLFGLPVGIFLSWLLWRNTR